MAKLVVHWSGGAQREVPLNQQRMVIGRGKHAEIHINDRTASGEHAAIVKIGSRCYLQDLESTNGTLVNGTPVQKHILKDGDEIRVGRTRISYVAEADLDATIVDDAPVEEIPVNMAGIAATEPAAEPTVSIKPAAEPAPLPAAPAPAAKPAAVAPPSTATAGTEYAPWASEDDKKDMVDSMIDAIRSHRDWVRTERINRKLSIDEEWKQLVEAAQVLKARLGGHPQLQFFNISRQQDEIMIRIRKSGQRSDQHAILLARQHPATESPLETIWLIETGEPDRHFSSCENIMRSVLRSLAPLIA